MLHSSLDNPAGQGVQAEPEAPIQATISAPSAPPDGPGSYKEIKITGKLSVERIPDDDESPSDSDSYTILLIGSTGVGKSRFIECLSGGISLGISKDQLESVTQEVIAYRLVNATVIHEDEAVEDQHPFTIYLVDTPGFSDRKMSEMKILNKVQTWMSERDIPGYDRIMYFDRITDTRMSGSKGRNLNLFKALTSENTAKNLVVVTTMWDLLWNDGQKEKAEKRYQQLQDQHWKEYLDIGTRIVRFTNTESSALSILDNSMATWSYKAANFERNVHKKNIHTAPYALPLYENLLDRVSQLQLRLQEIEQDLIQPSTQDNPILVDIFLQDKAEVEDDLRGALKEVEDFGPPPAAFMTDTDHPSLYRTSSFVSFHYLFNTPQPEPTPEPEPTPQPEPVRKPKALMIKSRIQVMVNKTKQKARFLLQDFKFRSSKF